MIHRYYFLLLVMGIFLPAGVLKAQQNPFSTVFYDMNSSVKAYAFTAASDNGYIIAGERNGGGMVMKTDTAGNIAWIKKIGDQYNQLFTCITSAYDGGYVVAGMCYNADQGTEEALIIKTGANGDTLWCRSVYPGYDASLVNVLQCSNHDLLVVGKVTDKSGPNARILVVRLSETGHVLWTHTYTALNNYNDAYSIREAGNNEFIVTGNVENLNPFKWGMFLMKINGAGDVLWSKLYSDNILNDYISGSDLLVIDSELYVLMNSADGSSTYLLKADSAGTLNWCRKLTAGGWVIDQTYPKLHRTTDDHLVFVTPGEWGRMVKAGLDGQLEWTVGLFMEPADVMEAPDHSLMVIGNGPIYGVKSRVNINPHIGMILTGPDGIGVECTDPMFPVDFELIALDTASLDMTLTDGFTVSAPQFIVADEHVSIRSGCVDFIGGLEEAGKDGGSIGIYPNPASVSFRLDLPAEELSRVERVRIINTSGRQVADFPAGQTLYDISGLSEGLYEVLVITGREVRAEKMVIMGK